METKKTSTKFANLLNKTAEIGKKATAKIQQGAENISATTQKTILEQRIKHYNPLFRETFESESFFMPNIIQIVDDAVRRNVDVCEGAIGWTKKAGGVEVLYLYDEFVEESKINFVPFPKCDAIYCVDVFDKTKYINVDRIFDRSIGEKIAELEHIAYSLGAKSCSIEISESEGTVESSSQKALAGKSQASASTEKSVFSSNQTKQSGKNISYFTGNTIPVHPTLKWFKDDDNIKNLIDMRLSGNHTITSKSLTFKGSSSATMSRKDAVAIDFISNAKGSTSMEKKSIKEHGELLNFELEF